MKTKKLCSMLLSAVMLISAAAVVRAEETGEESTLPVYKSTDAWSETAPGNELWTWEHSDKVTGYEYKALSNNYVSRENFGRPITATAQDKTAADAWCGGTEWNEAAVGEHWMIPYIKTSNTTAAERAKFAVSRTFKAPVSGHVVFSTEDGNIYGGSKEKSSANSNAFIKITRNGEQIWPASGEVQIPWDRSWIQTYDFEDFSAYVTKNDVIRFEVYNGDGSSGYGKLVYWAPTITYTSAEDADITYKSADAWPETMTNTTVIKNDDPVWQFIYRNNISNNAYKAYAYDNNSAGNATQDFVAPVLNEDGTYDYSYKAASGAHIRVFCDSTTNAYARNVIGKYWMRPAVATESNPKQDANNRLVKSFTAPKSGNITITAEDMLGDSKIYNRKLDSTNTKGAVVNILKWSADGKNEVIWTHTFAYDAETTPADGVAVLDFENITTNVNKGEQIWFMVSAATGHSAYAKQVFWNPVVVYNSVDTTAPAYVYKATEAWDETAYNTYNGHTEWKWEYYRAADATPKYNELTKKNTGKARFGQDPLDTATDGTAGIAWCEAAEATNGAGVGKYWMVPKAESAPAADVKKNNSVSRTFTSPMTGTVVLTTENTDAKGIAHVYGGSPNPAENAPAYLRITRNGTQIWPKYNAEYRIHTDTTFSQDAAISPLAITVNEGDVIRFEAYNGTGDTGWGKRVYWTPQVEYVEVAPTSLVTGTAKFTAADTKELTSFAEIVSAGTVNVSLPVTLTNYADTPSIMCVAVYNSDKELINVALSEVTPLTSGLNTLTVNNMNVTSITDGYIKIFLVDSMESLNPLSDIGESAVYTSEVQE